MTEEIKKDAPEQSDADKKDNVIHGDKPGEINQTVVEQAKAARKEDETGDDSDGGKADTSAAEANYTDEQKKADLALKARHEHLESIGLDAEASSQAGGDDLHKVEDADTKEEMYTGLVTVTGVDGQYHKKISTRIDCTSTPKGKGWLEYAFKTHFPSADLKAGIEIDPTNSSDPLLRTQYE